MKLKDYIKQLELLIVAWENGEAELNSVDIKAIKVLLEDRKEIIDYLKERIEISKSDDTVINGMYFKSANRRIYEEVLSKIEKE